MQSTASCGQSCTTISQHWLVKPQLTSRARLSPGHTHEPLLLHPDLTPATPTSHMRNTYHYYRIIART